MRRRTDYVRGLAATATRESLLETVVPRPLWVRALEALALLVAIVSAATVFEVWNGPAGAGKAVKYVVTVYPLGPMPKRPAAIEVEDHSEDGLEHEATFCGLAQGDWVVCVAAVDADGRQSAWACDTLLVNGTPTGIPGEPAIAAEPTICPNPSSGQVLIVSPIEGSLEIFDALGRAVLELEVEVGIQRERMMLPSGVYFWRLAQHTGKLTVLQ